MQDLKDIRDAAVFHINEKNRQLKDVYDHAESLVSKIKLFFMINRKAIAILAGTHIAVLVVGLLF